MIALLCSFGKDAKKDKKMPPDLHRLLLVTQYYYRVKESTAADIVNMQTQMALQVLSGLIPTNKTKALVPYSNANWKVDQSLSTSRGRHARPVEAPSLRTWLSHKSHCCNFCLTTDTITKGSPDYFDVRAPVVCPGKSNVVYRQPVVQKGTIHANTPTVSHSYRPHIYIVSTSKYRRLLRQSSMTGEVKLVDRKDVVKKAATTKTRQASKKTTVTKKATKQTKVGNDAKNKQSKIKKTKAKSKEPTVKTTAKKRTKVGAPIAATVSDDETESDEEEEEKEEEEEDGDGVEGGEGSVDAVANGADDGTPVVETQIQVFDCISCM
jgi:hypothetical protein